MSTSLHAQISLETSDYRSNTTAGIWEDVAAWEIWDGLVWSAATEPPNQNHNVFIEQGHTIILNKNESVKSLYLDNTNENRLDLAGYSLDIYGTINAYSGNAPGVGGGASIGIAGVNWIHAEEGLGKIVFKGESRTITGHWSAQNDRSVYWVEFDPGPGVVLSLDRNFKSSGFTVRSGIVHAGTQVFSFPTIGTTAPSGDFIIESGAELITGLSGNTNAFVQRSGSTTARLFELQEGAILRIRGLTPTLDASIIHFYGDVYYEGITSATIPAPQSFIAHKSANNAYAVTQTQYHNLYFSGNAPKNLPENLEVAGNLEFLGGGELRDNTTTLTFNGDQDQYVINTSIQIHNLSLDKSAGTVFMEENIEIFNDFQMLGGDLDIGGNSIDFNTGLNGTYQYLSGNWKNILQFHYRNIPDNLDAGNATFPFYDTELDGRRYMRILGSHSSSDTDLSIQYHPSSGVNWDPGFSDTDGTLILYQLMSYFSFPHLPDGTEQLEFRIGGDNLIIDELEDIRIVSDGEVAPGTHLEAEDDGIFWARRTLDFAALQDFVLTIGSTGVLSILPLEWANLTAMENDSGIEISWEISESRRGRYFEIHRGIDSLDDFEKVGEVSIPIDSKDWLSYSFQDTLDKKWNRVYYQIHSISWDNSTMHSPLLRVDKTDKKEKDFTIYPNPFYGGEIHMVFPDPGKTGFSSLQISNVHGAILYSVAENAVEERKNWTGFLRSLVPGMYVIQLHVNGKIHYVKWIKK